MKGKLCGLLSALFITLGLSLSINLNDTSALKYDIQKIPIYFPSSVSASPNFYNVPGFKLLTSDDIDYSRLRGQYVFSLTENNNNCDGVAYTHLPIIGDENSHLSISYGFAGFDNLTSGLSYSPCSSVQPINNINSESVANLVSPLNPTMSRNDLTSMIPYRFKWDGIRRTDVRDEDGLYYSTKFDLQNIFRAYNYPTTIYDMYVPFGSGKSSVSDTFTNNMPINFSGEFIADFDDYSSANGFTSNTMIELETYYLDPNGYSGPDISSCNTVISRDNLDDPLSVYSIKYNCSITLRDSYENNYYYFYDPASQMPYFRLHVRFDYANSANTKFSQFIFDSSISITNNDSTPAGDWDNPVQGADPDSAPGSATNHDYSDDSDGDPDYGLSLENMFNFNFINPFEPILHLFTDSDSCVQIPTIAGMIHSQETQVCPWFDSNVRNIVTPVLGLSSMMLVFGFAVRWLGSSSGNMFEDSGSIQPPGYSATGGTAIHHGWRRKK